MEIDDNVQEHSEISGARLLTFSRLMTGARRVAARVWRPTNRRTSAVEFYVSNKNAARRPDERVATPTRLQYQPTHGTDKFSYSNSVLSIRLHIRLHAQSKLHRRVIVCVL